MTAPKLKLTKRRDLTLADGGHLSAASGLVRIIGKLFVIADDEHYLGIFDEAGVRPGERLPLFAGDLPVAKTERKRAKPDLEALVALPAGGRFAQGALMMLGSGSAEARHRGVLMRFGSDGGLDGKIETLDLTAIHAQMSERIADLNIEGAAVSGGDLLLFHRGNRSHPDNVVARMTLETVLAHLIDRVTFAVPDIRFSALRLGEIRGVPFSVTDAAALPDGGLLVTAVAEDTGDAYNDGACIGAAIFRLTPDLEIAQSWRLDRPHKIEGIAATVAGTRADILLVTDADDPAILAALFEVRLDFGPPL